MKYTVPKFRPVFILVTITLWLFCLLAAYFLKNDFWQDEIYTIEHFVFSSWRTVFTDYHSTNNHIAFNSIVKVVVKVFDVNAVFSALKYPYLLRVVPYTFSLLSLLVFYSGVKRHYGKLFALISLSAFCTTIVFVDFGAQLRGYSLGIFFTLLQYFTFIDIVKEGRRLAYLKLFFITLLSLLCLPTNIYLILAYLLFCFILFLMPSVSTIFFVQKEARVKWMWITITISSASALILGYYFFLLQLQPENPLITSFNSYNFKNLIQAFAIFFHFTDFRYHFFLFLLVWLFLFLRYSIKGLYSKVLLPAFLFFIPFLFFYVHGAIIIQRTFLPLLPFFILIIAAVVEEVGEKLKVNYLYSFFCITNLICLIVSFSVLIRSSEQNNKLSVHKHDLRNHYYLVNFNATEVSLKARDIVKKKKLLLYLWDDYGGTGVEYYLNRYKVPFERYSSDVDFDTQRFILANNKVKLEMLLHYKQVPFKKLFNSEDQYNLYLLFDTNEESKIEVEKNNDKR
jgi:hypothetical protein